MAHGSAGGANTLITNGASLEDCYTNVFVLSELSGLKWCRYSTGPIGVEICREISEDPVLQAYSECLKQDLLCVWRRVPVQTPHFAHPSTSSVPSKIDLNLAAEKELWVFWYGDDQPPELKKTCASLTRAEEASWEKGIEYETRSLLFKALHNKIERTLLEKDCVRLGRWFVQPLNGDEIARPPKYLLAFKYSFFIHGENNVCLSVTVQQKPPICRLSRAHLAKRETGYTQKVLLAPFCVSATLSSQCQVNFETDAQASKLWREWSDFYPLPELDNTENIGYLDAAEKERQDQLRALAPPQMVQVVVSGVRLKYPTAYVLVECPPSQPPLNNGSSLTTTEPQEENKRTAIFDRLSSAPEILSLFSNLLLQRSEEELVTGTHASTTDRRQSQSHSNNSLSEIQPQQPQSQEDETTPFVCNWDFIDETHKESCSCGRAVGGSAPSAPPVLNKAQLKFGYTTPVNSANSSLSGAPPSSFRQQKLLERQARMARPGPFHRRPLARINRATPSASVTPALMELQPTSAAGATATTAPAETENAPNVLMTTPVSPSVLMHASPKANGTIPTSTKEPVVAPALTKAPSSVKSTTASASLPSGFSYNNGNSGNGATAVIKSAMPQMLRCVKRKFDGRLIKKAWKRPRLNATDTSVSVGVGVLCPIEEANPSTPNTFACMPAGEWFTKKLQKHELTNLRPFATADIRPTPDTILNRTDRQQQESISASQQHTQSSLVSAVPTSPFASGQSSSAIVGRSSNGGGNLPENIMEDSPTDISPHEFLSPPPSHGQEDDHFSSNGNVSTLARQNAQTENHMGIIPTSSTTAKGRVDYSIIYPTPPSIENPQAYPFSQLSPETNQIAGNLPGSPCQIVNGMDYSSSLTVEPVSSSRKRSQLGGSRSLATSERWQQLSTVMENERIGKYLLAKAYAPNRSLRRSTVTLTPFLASVAGSAVPIWHRNDHRVQQQVLKSGSGIIHPTSPFVSYPSPGHRTQNSAPDSPAGVVLPPPPYGLHRGWPSPMAVGSPFNGRPIPATANSMGTPRTPAAASSIFDLQSPVSNASSSYLRNENSVENTSATWHTPGSAMTAGENAPAPEGHGLVLSLLLCDTVANLFRDISFDSCPLCVCSMGILGVDAGTYVVVSSSAVNASSSRQMSLQNTKCSCGFSAMRYRYLSWRSGMFFEDEYEATGVWPISSKSTDLNIDPQRSAEFIAFVRYRAFSDIVSKLDYRSALESISNTSLASDQLVFSCSSVELRDLTDMCNTAIEQACLMMDCTKPARDDFPRNVGLPFGVANRGSANERYLVGDWGYRSSKEATNSECMFVLEFTASILHEAMLKSRGTVWQNSRQSTVEGPLSWRQMHRKCSNRSTNDWSGPEPIPQLMLATDRDWVTISPFALRYWDRLPLEPYGQPKDIVYIAVVPDSHYVVQRARIFFRELSKTYEALRLGRHCPITRVLQDGMMRVGKNLAKQATQKPVDPSFDRLSDQYPQLGAKLKIYAQMCGQYLSAHLQSENVFDRSIFRDVAKESAPPTAGQQPAQTPDSSGSMLPPPDPVAEQSRGIATAGGGSQPAATASPAPAGTTAATNTTATESSGAASAGADGETAELETTPISHSLVIYLVDPFTFGIDNEDEKYSKAAAAGLHQCYLEFLRELPDAVKHNVQIEIVPLQNVFEMPFSETAAGCSQSDYLRRLSFSVFHQSRSIDFNCLSSTVAKPLTGFGPAASRLELIRRKSEQKGSAANIRAYCPPVILAPSFEKNVTSIGHDVREESCRVLFVSYCLSENQDWLFVTATDHQGLLLEDCVIDLRVANRQCVTKRPYMSPEHGPEGSVIWEALRKVWNFVTMLLTTDTHAWRLVIGRLGRLGHEELKAWAHYLCKNRLRATSRMIRERCGMCAALPTCHDTEMILSACLISTAPDTPLRIFSNYFSHDDRFGQGAKWCPLSTPEDVSCTHVMVFPTSAHIQVNQSAITGGIAGTGMDDVDDAEDVFLGLDLENIDFEFNFNECGADIDDKTGAFDSSVIPNRGLMLSEASDEAVQMQPLALGYLVSTAPADHLPNCFWTERPSTRNGSPVHLRSALHIHTYNVQQSDDQLLQTSAGVGGGYSGGGARSAQPSHALDSTLTTDVLRYVLETYNSLSWLTVDVRTGDRRTCMPVHIDHLCRLYNATNGYESATTS